MLSFALPVAFALAITPDHSLFHYCSDSGKVVASQSLIQKGGEVWQLKRPLITHGHDWVSGTFGHIRNGERLADKHLRLRVLPEDLIVLFPDADTLTASSCSPSAA